MDLGGKTALVQGGGAGIGLACVEKLAAKGCRVAFGGRNIKTIEQVARDIRSSGAEALPVQADVSKEEDVRRLFEETRRAFGPVDVLVNNVGALEMKPLHEVTPEDWHRIISQNLHSAYYCCREALLDMAPRKSGVIVNIGSGGAREPAANAAPYCAAKFGLRGLTLSIAEEVRSKGVKVAIVNPVGVIDKPIVRARGRGGNPTTWMQTEDLADAVIFIAEQGSRAMTLEIDVTPPAPEYG